MRDDCYVHWEDVDIPLSFGVVTAVSCFSAPSVYLDFKYQIFAGKPQFHHLQPSHSTQYHDLPSDEMYAMGLDHLRGCHATVPSTSCRMRIPEPWPPVWTRDAALRCNIRGAPIYPPHLIDREETQTYFRHGVPDCFSAWQMRHAIHCGYLGSRAESDDSSSRKSERSE
jgi:hypothetical protein